MKALTEALCISKVGKVLVMGWCLKFWSCLVFAWTKMAFGVACNPDCIVKKPVGIPTIGTSHFQQQGKKRHSMPINQDVIPAANGGNS